MWIFRDAIWPDQLSKAKLINNVIYITYQVKFKYKASPDKAQVHKHKIKHEYFF